MTTLPGAAGSCSSLPPGVLPVTTKGSSSWRPSLSFACLLPSGLEAKHLASSNAASSNTRERSGSASREIAGGTAVSSPERTRARQSRSFRKEHLWPLCSTTRRLRIDAHMLLNDVCVVAVMAQAGSHGLYSRDANNRFRCVLCPDAIRSAQPNTKHGEGRAHKKCVIRLTRPLVVRTSVASVSTVAAAASSSVAAAASSHSSHPVQRCVSAHARKGKRAA